MYYPTTLILLSIALSTSHASKETLSACVSEQENLYESIELQDAFKDMMTSYNETCHEEGLCTYEMHEDTKESILAMKDKSETTSFKDMKGLKGSGDADFGGAFYDHKSFKRYVTACEDAGGDMVCVDANMNMEGELGAAFIPDGDQGIETDVKIAMKSYPVCMTKECEGEDMTTVLENTSKNAFLKNEKVADEMTAQVESMIKAATVKQVCALSGLETCELTVIHEKCSVKAEKIISAAINSAAISVSMQGMGGLFFTVLAVSMTTLFSLF